jgi:hypothetical protein
MPASRAHHQHNMQQAVFSALTASCSRLRTDSAKRTDCVMQQAHEVLMHLSRHPIPWHFWVQMNETRAHPSGGCNGLVAADGAEQPE